VRAIWFIFLFACTGDYIDTFWSASEQVNSCLPSVKYYWGLRGETIYLDNSGAEISIVEDSDCETDTADACINKELRYIHIDSWIKDYNRLCDVIAHEIGHGLDYQHSKKGIMAKEYPLDEEPIILPVSNDHQGIEWP
jgi:hypothetical protein